MESARKSMVNLFYLLSLLLSIGAMVSVDYRYRLAFFYQFKRSAKTLALAVGMFIAWDLLGISLGIFFTGESRYVTDILLLPELPLEELFFLFFLSYFTLILYRLLEKLWSRM